MKNKLIPLLIFFLFIFPNAFALTQLESNPSSFSVEYEEENMDSSVSNNLSLGLTIMNQDLQPYQLSVSQTPFIPEAPFQIKIRIPYSMIDEGTFLEEELILSMMQERLIYENQNPSFEMQPMNLFLDIEIPSGLTAGIYQTILIFKLYEMEKAEDPVDPFIDPMSSLNIPNTPTLTEIEIPIEIRITEVLKMELSFLDADQDQQPSAKPSINYLDFGIIDPDSSYKDKKIVVSIISNLSKPYRLFQRRGDDMVSDLSNLAFYENGLVYEADNSSITGKINQDEPLPVIPEDTLIYESDSKGSSDTIPIYYAIKEPHMLHAGRYQTNLTFYLESVESNELPPVKETFDVFLEVKKKFQVVLTPQNRELYLDFSPDEPGQLFSDQIVQIDVVSNLGINYQLIHNLKFPFMNNKGGQVNEENFLYSLLTENSMDSREFQPMNTIGTPLFSSDEKGDSASFQVLYRMKIQKEQMSGSYQSEINYTLTTD